MKELTSEEEIAMADSIKRNFVSNPSAVDIHVSDLASRIWNGFKFEGVRIEVSPCEHYKGDEVKLVFLAIKKFLASIPDLWYGVTGNSVVLSSDDAMRVFYPEGIPEKVDALLAALKGAFTDPLAAPPHTLRRILDRYADSVRMPYTERQALFKQFSLGDH